MLRGHLAKLVADAMASVPDIPDSVDGDGQLFDLIIATTRIDAWSESIRARLTALLYERTLAEHRQFGLAAHADTQGTAAGAERSPPRWGWRGLRWRIEPSPTAGWIHRKRCR